MKDQYYMRRAIELSLKGTGFVNPNPLVGAVLVKNNKIIGEGYHAIYGGPHAEVNAIYNSSQDCSGATMYVTLEPCSHYGKTPPCALKIIENNISRVVIGMADPNPLVSGNGIKLLEDANIEVTTGILSKEIELINEVFIHYITNNAPFVVMKTASTLDGKIATSTGHSRWVSSGESRTYVHELRQRYSGIMAGINTILKDNPELNIRHLNGTVCHPHRIIVDSKARTPLQSKVLNKADDVKTFIAVTDDASKINIKNLKDQGAVTILCPKTEYGVDLNYLMKKLAEFSIDSILLEGGGILNYSAIHSGIVNKVISFIAPKIIGGKDAPTPVSGSGIKHMDEAIHLKSVRSHMIGDDVVIEGYLN